MIISINVENYLIKINIHSLKFSKIMKVISKYDQDFLNQEKQT